MIALFIVLLPFAEGFRLGSPVLARSKRTELQAIDRRQALGLGAAVTLASISNPNNAAAVGPISMELSDIKYSSTECPPDLKAGRIGGAFGGAVSKEVQQQCVKVTATAENPSKSPLKNVAVFGFVLDEQASHS